MSLYIETIGKNSLTVRWEDVAEADAYTLHWSSKNLATSRFLPLCTKRVGEELAHTVAWSTHQPYYFRLSYQTPAGQQWLEETLESPTFHLPRPQREVLDRGLVAMKTEAGVFLSWRLFIDEVTGFGERGMTSAPFTVLRNGVRIATVEESTNFLDGEGRERDVYQVVRDGSDDPSPPVEVWKGKSYDLPLQKPEGGVCPDGSSYEYTANDMTVADVDGDGQYEFILKWDPTNSQDVSIPGYTGPCLIDCYKLDGRLLWRLDMGVNIRAGAHYTQIMAYDFNGDGKAEISVKTGPGTKMTTFDVDGTVKSEAFVTMPEAGASHEDNYVCSNEDFHAHVTDLFMMWHDRPEVKSGQWPATLEACFGIEDRYAYPLERADAASLVDYLFDVYAPKRSARNRLREFRGFIYQGPEYLTMFAGDGSELETIMFPFPRVDDGLLWGDYAWRRIEPCNRVDRFLSGVAYLDGEHPSLIVCRGYYTRAAIAAYDFTDRFSLRWSADSGFVALSNPFNDEEGCAENGSDPIYGALAGQGNHSLSTADIDRDGRMEIIYGAAVIDDDGSLLYSSSGPMPDGTIRKFGHGDAMHVGDFDPDRPGLEIFNVFEGGEFVPQAYALRDAETGAVLWGHRASGDLGRCMVGDIDPSRRGYSCWINQDLPVYDCRGGETELERLGTNMSIRWAADISTQILDGHIADSDYQTNDWSKRQPGIINDLTHGVMLTPRATLTNNGTKGNPCLVADIWGDWREELLLRAEDSSAIRIYTSTEVTECKLFTLMHDEQYRTGIAWQNNCYNQPVYPKFYLGSDMDFSEVLPHMKRKRTLWLTGDSTMQNYESDQEPQKGWGEYLIGCLDGGVITEHEMEDPAAWPRKRYESGHVTVYNQAIGARSSRSFREEGRLAAIEEHLRPGDYLLIQFGHNDATPQKRERYVAVEDFSDSLRPFIEAAYRHDALPILVSPISMLTGFVCDAERKSIRESLVRYAEEMERLALREGVPFIDAFALTAAYQASLTEEERAALYMPDGVHLHRVGAASYAQLIAPHLNAIMERDTILRRKQ